MKQNSLKESKIKKKKKEKKQLEKTIFFFFLRKKSSEKNSGFLLDSLIETKILKKNILGEKKKSHEKTNSPERTNDSPNQTTNLK